MKSKINDKTEKIPTGLSLWYAPSYSIIVTGQSPSLLGMDKMLQEWKGADQFIIVKGIWFEKLMAE